MRAFSEGGEDVTPKAERSSGIELLKLVAIVMIVLCHASPLKPAADASGAIAGHVMRLGEATGSLQRFVIVLFYYGGSLGNAVFIVSSSWFLLESRGLDAKKLMYLAADAFCVSVLFLAAFVISGYELPLQVKLRQFFPITFGANWFVTCYFLFYLAHPALNLVIRGLGRRELLKADLALAFLYSGVQFLLPGALYFNRLIGFFCVYFIVAYVKKYMAKSFASRRGNVSLLACSLLGLLALLAATNCLGLRWGLFAGQLRRWWTFTNPLILAAALAAFGLARSCDFINGRVNYLAGMSMLIYVIHRNQLVADYLENDYFRYVYETHTYDCQLLWVALFAAFLLVGGVLLAALYKSLLQGRVRAFCDRLYAGLAPACSRLVDRLLRYE